MKQLLGLAVLLILSGILYCLKSPNYARASSGFWESGFSITDIGVPTGLTNSGNLDCNYISFKSRYVFKEKYVGSKLTYDPETYETTGRDYPDVCSVQNDQGIIGASGIWAKNLDTNKSLPIDSAPYSMIPAPGGNTVLFYDSAPGGGLEYSINHNLEYIGSLSTKTYGSGINARKEKIWKINTSKLDEMLTYADGSIVRIDQVGFSSNGRFLIAQLTHRGLVRIDLQTKELTPFFAVDYANGTGSYLQISNDGRYVASYKMNTDQFYIHDLDSCMSSFAYGLWPSTGILPTVGCKSMKYFDVVRSFNASIDLITGLRFSPNGASIQVLARVSAGAGKQVRILKLDATAYASNASGYLAMGDSFSSGEGDTQGGEWYEQGTDKQGDVETFNNRNLCHLSRRSYPYLMALQLGYSQNNLQSPPADGYFHSVACSGAKTHNVIGGTGEKQDDGAAYEFISTDNQYRYLDQSSLELWQPGASSQKNFLYEKIIGNIKRFPFSPEIITIGIGGNDAGFGQKLAACLMPGTCEFARSEEKRSEAVEEMAQERDNLVRVYEKLKSDAPDARIYVIGYPQFVTFPIVTCGNNVHLDESEVRFVHDSVSYFNQVIRSAANIAGVNYVDIENSLDGRNLCSGISDEDMAFNGATAGNDRGLPLFGTEGIPYSFGLCVYRNCIGSESFHPNQKGHAIFKDQILQQTQQLTIANPAPQETPIPIPSDYFGLGAISFVEALNNPTSEQLLRSTLKEMVVDMTSYRSPSVRLDGFLPFSSVSFAVHSDPISLGSFQADANGMIDVQLSIPESLTSGYHEISATGLDATGSQVSFYEPVVLGESSLDFDGDGVVNELDSCPAVTNSGIDIDVDGIDDACDIEVLAPKIIVEVPVEEEAPADQEGDAEALPENPLEETPEDSTAETSNNQNEVPVDDKGLPSSETSAGEEELVAESGGAVLGASTSASTDIDESSITSLVRTGQPEAVNVLLGVGILLSCVWVFTKTSKDIW